MVSKSVTASLEYLSPDSPISRRYVSSGSGVALNIGEYETRSVTIRNGRLEKISLAEQGFQLLRHRSALIDFREKAQVEAIYPEEMERLIAETTGADKVVSFSLVLRDVAHFGNGTLAQASEVHTDYTTTCAETMARSMLEKTGTPEFQFRRFAIINLWRAFSHPPQDWPLALCDARTIDELAGVPTPMIFVDPLPDPESALREEIPYDPHRHESTVFRFDPAHRWYYFPDMRADEIVLFKIYDSERTRAWRVPHTSFACPGLVGAVPRQSVEIRTIAYFK